MQVKWILGLMMIMGQAVAQESCDYILQLKQMKVSREHSSYSAKVKIGFMTRKYFDLDYEFTVDPNLLGQWVVPQSVQQIVMPGEQVPDRHNWNGQPIRVEDMLEIEVGLFMHSPWSWYGGGYGLLKYQEFSPREMELVSGQSKELKFEDTNGDGLIFALTKLCKDGSEQECDAYTDSKDDSIETLLESAGMEFSAQGAQLGQSLTPTCDGSLTQHFDNKDQPQGHQPHQGKVAAQTLSL